MEYKEIKGVKIPLIGLGTSGFGGGWMFKDSSHDSQATEAIQYAIELGMTHIDTAEAYANGHAEELVGLAIKDFPRKNLFITTKVYPGHLSRDKTLKACQASLKRLATDYIDLYLIHWPDPHVPLSETMPAMDQLVKQGLTRFIGVSNFDVGLLREAQSLSENGIFTNQVEYSLVERGPEKGLLPYCQKQNILLTAYSPLKKVPLDHLEQMAQKYGKTPAQIALNYLISQDNVIAIPKASSKEHIKENAEAADFKLDPEDLELLKQKS